MPGFGLVCLSAAEARDARALGVGDVTRLADRREPGDRRRMCARYRPESPSQSRRRSWLGSPDPVEIQFGAAELPRQGASRAPSAATFDGLRTLAALDVGGGDHWRVVAKRLFRHWPLDATPSRCLGGFPGPRDARASRSLSRANGTKAAHGVAWTSGAGP